MKSLFMLCIAAWLFAAAGFTQSLVPTPWDSYPFYLFPTTPKSTCVTAQTTHPLEPRRVRNQTERWYFDEEGRLIAAQYPVAHDKKRIEMRWIIWRYDSNGCVTAFGETEGDISALTDLAVQCQGDTLMLFDRLQDQVRKEVWLNDQRQPLFVKWLCFSDLKKQWVSAGDFDDAFEYDEWGRVLSCTHDGVTDRYQWEEGRLLLDRKLEVDDDLIATYDDQQQLTGWTLYRNDKRRKVTGTCVVSYEAGGLLP